MSTIFTDTDFQSDFDFSDGPPGEELLMSYLLQSSQAGEESDFLYNVDLLLLHQQHHAEEVPMESRCRPTPG